MIQVMGLQKIGILCCCLSALSAKNYDHIYFSLKSNSILQHLTYYNLFPEEKTSENAVNRAISLINQHRKNPLKLEEVTKIPFVDIEGIIALFSQQSYIPHKELSDQQIAFISSLASELKHRKLKGSLIWNIEDLMDLPDDDIDLGRSLLLYEFGNNRHKILSYEALLDLIALEIQGRLSPNAGDLDMIREINEFIFFDMRFRFPPLSTQNDQSFTFLPLVMDSRHGVCLGVSILYLCIAQRIGLPLTIITPPGHIFVSYRNENIVRNIETTHRGVHLPDKEYLSIGLQKLEKRSIKEVIGLNFFNAAAPYWESGHFQKVLDLYEIARKFVSPKSPILPRLTAYAYALLGEKDKALHWFAQCPYDEYTTYKDTVQRDYTKGHLSKETLYLIFCEHPKTRKELQNYLTRLQQRCSFDPKSETLKTQIAFTWFQLGRTQEAIQALEEAHQINPKNPQLKYFLSLGYYYRNQPIKALHLIEQCKQIFEKRGYKRKELTHLEKSFLQSCPFYENTEK